MGTQNEHTGKDTESSRREERERLGWGSEERGKTGKEGGPENVDPKQDHPSELVLFSGVVEL